jgi:hypothetical protein
VSLLDRLRAPAARPLPPLPLSPLLEALAQAAPRLTGRAVDPAWARARLADRCRDLGVSPPDAQGLDKLAASLDGEAWRRVALLLSAFDAAPAKPALQEALASEAAARSAFYELPARTPLLTLELLAEGPLRREELARRFVAALGLQVQGESLSESGLKLERLDSERLLGEAERARREAESQSLLRKLQAEMKK